MQTGYAPTRLYPQAIVGNIGFEPMTLRLSIGCSTTEPIAHTIKKIKKRCALRFDHRVMIGDHYLMIDYS